MGVGNARGARRRGIRRGLHNRLEPPQWQEWLGEFEILISEPAPGPATGTRCGESTTIAQPHGVGPYLTACDGRHGSYVTLRQFGPARYITIAEIAVFTHFSPPSPPPPLPPIPPPPEPRPPPTPHPPPTPLPPMQWPSKQGHGRRRAPGETLSNRRWELIDMTLLESCNLTFIIITRHGMRAAAARHATAVRRAGQTCIGPNG